MNRTRVLILGAAGRDFHDFNVLYRHDPSHEVVGFTAQQIPHIADRGPASSGGYGRSATRNQGFSHSARSSPVQLFTT